MKGDMAAAVKNGMIVVLAADDLRVGDLVLVQAGNIVPADLKLLEASDLEVDEFEVTGEIMPVPMMALLLFLLLNNNLIRPLLLGRLQKKLLRRNILLRHGRVLEDLRKVDVFCFDKTGVLTRREIKVKEIYLAGEKSSPNRVLKGETWDLIMTGCTRCQDLAYHQTIGLANSLDRALMSFAEENGINIDEALHQYQKFYHKPFNSEERYMACGYDHVLSGKRAYFAKGDPEVLLKKCNRYLTPWGERKSPDFSFWAAVRGKMEEMSDDGSVIIALACSEDSLEEPPLR